MYEILIRDNYKITIKVKSNHMLLYFTVLYSTFSLLYDAHIFIIDRNNETKIEVQQQQQKLKQIKN